MHHFWSCVVVSFFKKLWGVPSKKPLKNCAQGAFRKTREGHNMDPAFTRDRQGVVYKPPYVSMSACLSATHVCIVTSQSTSHQLLLERQVRTINYQRHERAVFYRRDRSEFMRWCWGVFTWMIGQKLIPLVPPQATPFIKCRNVKFTDIEWPQQCQYFARSCIDINFLVNSLWKLWLINHTLVNRGSTYPHLNNNPLLMQQMHPKSVQAKRVKSCNPEQWPSAWTIVLD